MRNTLGSGYDRWLTTEPDWTYEVPPLKCGTCGRFVSRATLLREEPWEDGWQCDGKVLDAGFTWCSDIMNEARQCWQEGWTEAERVEHNGTHHKYLENPITKCGDTDAHEPHYVIEAAGKNLYFQCSGGHEAKDVVM